MQAIPLISADMLIQAIKSRQIKITMALIHPNDMPRYNIDGLRLLLGGTDVLPSADVERGFLYITSKQLR